MARVAGGRANKGYIATAKPASSICSAKAIGPSGLFWMANRWEPRSPSIWRRVVLRGADPGSSFTSAGDVAGTVAPHRTAVDPKFQLAPQDPLDSRAEVFHPWRSRRSGSVAAGTATFRRGAGTKTFWIVPGPATTTFWKQPDQNIEPGYTHSTKACSAVWSTHIHKFPPANHPLFGAKHSRTNFDQPRQHIEHRARRPFGIQAGAEAAPV